MSCIYDIALLSWILQYFKKPSIITEDIVIESAPDYAFRCLHAFAFDWLRESDEAALTVRTRQVSAT
jgi:hypothetical protein